VRDSRSKSRRSVLRALEQRARLLASNLAAETVTIERELGVLDAVGVDLDQARARLPAPYRRTPTSTGSVAAIRAAMEWSGRRARALSEAAILEAELNDARRKLEQRARELRVTRAAVDRRARTLADRAELAHRSELRARRAKRDEP